MNITIGYATAILRGADPSSDVADQLVSAGRWTETRMRVFTHPAYDGYWAFEYEVGLTEMQECEPFEYLATDTVPCYRVEGVPVTFTEWRKVS